MFACASASQVAKASRRFFLLPGYNYNYMNNSLPWHMFFLFQSASPTPRKHLRSPGSLPQTSPQTHPELARCPSASLSSPKGGRKIVLPLRFRVPQKECGKRSSITFFRFRDAFGHFSVTFCDAFVTFFVTFLQDSFCRTPFAAG